MTGNVIQGNHIGVNVQGNAAIPNQREGININSFNSNVPVTGNTVGGTEPGAGNVISGNLSDGISLGGFHVMNNTVQGNLIGTDASGNFAINNNGHGIECTGNNNLIGGSVAGARNVISGSSANGVHLEGSGNIVRGNIIGANLSLTAAIPNFFHGVSLNGSNSVIGGTNAGEANVIAFNGADGIAAVATSATANSFRANSIFSNGFLTHPSDARIGIDLGAFGPTPNDSGDGDTGANNLQNFPVITSVTPGANSVNVIGTLNSTAATLFALDFYANSVCDPLGFGEGARLIGSVTVLTNGSGDASFDFTFQGTQPDGQVYTATATDPSGNTSEFSQCSAPSPAIGSVSFSSTSVLVSEAAGMAFFALEPHGR